MLIRSSDPATPRAIRTNLLVERGDVDALVPAFERTREIIATEPIASNVERELLPGPGTDLETHLRSTAMTMNHPSCSVAMGSEADSPLDEKRRVRGVESLRVADVSVLPRIPRADSTPHPSCSANAAPIPSRRIGRAVDRLVGSVGSGR